MVPPFLGALVTSPLYIVNLSENTHILDGGILENMLLYLLELSKKAVLNKRHIFSFANLYALANISSAKLNGGFVIILSYFILRG